MPPNTAILQTISRENRTTQSKIKLLGLQGLGNTPRHNAKRKGDSPHAIRTPEECTTDCRAMETRHHAHYTMRA